LDVHLFGQAAEYESFFDNVLEAVAYMGIGQHNEACHLKKVQSWDIEAAKHTGNDSFLSVEFITPCARLKSQGVVYRDEIPFFALFARLADRVDELNRLYGDGRDSLTEGGTGE